MTILIFGQRSLYFCSSSTAALITSQKRKFPIKSFFNKCDQIRRKLPNLQETADVVKKLNQINTLKNISMKFTLK